MKVPDLGRWPLLLAAALCVTGAMVLFKRTSDTDDGRTAAFILVLFAAFLLGGFLVDWGGRHFFDRHDKDKDSQ